MLKYFGAENVRVLNGGFKKWKADGRFTHSGPQQYPELEANFDYRIPNPEICITDINEVHKSAFYISKKASNW